MSTGQTPAPKPVLTVTEMNGRIEELERQRNEALTRCATLSGIAALQRQTLTEAYAEIERLNGLVPVEIPAAETAPDATPAPILK
ncbi:hypothetical protein [Methylobacterium sp. J-068]|uniref:hypothetical protein n=1 Tax=Methylobacterium sp. J-068 TaxID=2836649 RepID=UPI001FB89AA3|nr:hypothetical protein [Methylobacterium sp. J-068]MCJ2032887.1 hypothetical protein [Methylobacterium sp. J-068]